MYVLQHCTQRCIQQLDGPLHHESFGNTASGCLRQYHRENKIESERYICNTFQHDDRSAARTNIHRAWGVLSVVTCHLLYA